MLEHNLHESSWKEQDHQHAGGGWYGEGVRPWAESSRCLDWGSSCPLGKSECNDEACSCFCLWTPSLGKINFGDNVSLTKARPTQILFLTNRRHSNNLIYRCVFLSLKNLHQSIEFVGRAVDMYLSMVWEVFSRIESYCVRMPGLRGSLLQRCRQCVTNQTNIHRMRIHRRGQLEMIPRWLARFSRPHRCEKRSYSKPEVM